MTRPLRVAIIHYHLRPGGVTRVIGHAAAALQKSAVRLVVLSGTPVADIAAVPAPCVNVPDLAYTSVSDRAPARLAEQLLATATSALGAPPDLLHIHNHSLGKNLAFTSAVYILAERGQRLLLQIHDFPEDGRPDNYRVLRRALAADAPLCLGAQLYPLAPHVHYAALNQRDTDFLRKTGMDAAQLHLLPNPVALESGPPSRADDTPLWIYPTRAIRRKNLGEFILWAALAEPDEHFAVTLAPTTPSERVRYDDWVHFVTQHQLPVEFEAGKKDPAPLVTLLQHARYLCTTSVAEGFGLAFLEAALVGRPLLGRDLPEITQDLKACGLRLDNLYERLVVPQDWIGTDTLRTTIATAYTRSMAAYGRALSPADIERAFTAAITPTGVDFGRLDEPLQQQVIRRVCQDKAAWALLRQQRRLPVSADNIAHNQRVITEHFSVAGYGKRLAELYSAVADSEPAPLRAGDAGSLLDQFLQPERFFLLRT